MPETLEIRKIIKKIENAKAEIRRQKTGMKREVQQTPTWWSGNAANSFRNRYNQSDADIERLCRKLNDLQLNMKNLLRAVEDAEQDRKSIAAKIRG